MSMFYGQIVGLHKQYQPLLPVREHTFQYFMCSHAYASTHNPVHFHTLVPLRLNFPVFDLAKILISKSDSN